MQQTPLHRILTKLGDIIPAGNLSDFTGMRESIEGWMLTKVMHRYGPPGNIGHVARHRCSFSRLILVVVVAFGFCAAILLIGSALIMPIR